MRGLILKQRQPVGMNFQHTTPLTPLKTVSMILPDDTSRFEYFVEEYCSLIFPLHKQLLFADEYRSEAHFLPIKPAPTQSRCTPPYLREHFRALYLKKFKFCSALRESLRIERNSVCASTLVSLMIKENSIK